MVAQPRRSSRRTAVALAAVVVSGLLGASTLASTAASAGEKKKTQSWLYVIDAGSASVESGRLTLTGLDPIAVGFSDRPKRKVARFPVSELVAAWDELGFTDVPPNAAVAWFDGDTERTVVVELSEPQEEPGGLSFAYRALTSTPKRLRSSTADPQADLPARFDDVVVFIDHAYPTNVNDQITD